MKHADIHQQAQGKGCSTAAARAGPRAPSAPDMQTLCTLDRQLVAAHSRNDRHGMVGLYAQAAELARDEVACAFYLTQAWVFALDIGDTRAHELGTRLAAMGRA